MWREGVRVNFQDVVDRCLDELLPPPEQDRPLAYVEDRHILKCYIVTGSQIKAGDMLQISYRTIRNRMSKMFPPHKLLALPGSRGRTDLGFLIEYVVQRMPRDMALPPIAKKSPVWRDNRIRGLALHRPDEVLPPVSQAIEDDVDDGLTYPCHRDFDFWDWYMNQDHIKMHKSHGVGTAFREDLHGEA